MNALIEQRKQNWIDFYDLTSPVNRLVQVSYSGDIPPGPPLWWENVQKREEHAYKKYMRAMNDLERINDNTIPFLSVTTGTEIFAEAFGCDVYKPLNSNPVARPLIHSVSE